MKQLLAFVVLIAAAAWAYHMHRSTVKVPAPVATPSPRAVAISRKLEPSYQALFSDLNRDSPADLVPPLEITRERILDKKTHVEPQKQPVYDAAAALVSAMIIVGEERTKALQELLKATAQSKASLETATTANRSSAFFAQGITRRWDDERKRRKPAVDQLFARLRDAERGWNQHVPPNARADSFDSVNVAQVDVTIDPATTEPRNALERGAYDQRRVVYPWRRSYYDRYGYPR